MRSIIFVLIFSIVLLFFFIFPSIKIVEFFDKDDKLSDFNYNLFTVLLTICLSLMGGIFLEYWKL